jgi:hypothetical protein
MPAKVIHWPLVRYRGSLTQLHGTIWQDVSTPGPRLTLKCSQGYALTKVNPASVAPIDVPALTPDRAEALRWLVLGNDRVPAPRVLRWLTRHQLAQQADERTELTALGRELADALVWF